MRVRFSILLLAICGCTHVHPLNPAPGAAERDAFNLRAVGHRVSVARTDGTAFVALGALLDGTSLVWSDSMTGQPGIVPLASIAELSFRDRSRGAADGILVGGGVGLVLGGIFFVSLAGVCQGGPCSMVGRLPAFLVTILPAGFLGMVVGGGVGASRRYVVGTPER